MLSRIRNGHTDVIAILRKSFEDYHGYPHYAIGRVCFADEEEVTVKTFNRYRYIPFGSIMFEKSMRSGFADMMRHYPNGAATTTISVPGLT